MKLIEVAAMPFPSHQGTQALVREQCDALHRRGHEVHLLTYAGGDETIDYEPAHPIHRLRDWPRDRSLRSGPSWQKLLLDGQLVWRIRRLDRQLAPDVVHAHNYEALAACLAAHPRAPILYHAHTLFGPELPTYVSGASRGARLVAGAGGRLADRLLPPMAARTVVVSPSLEEHLISLGHPRERIEVCLPGIELPPPPARASRTPGGVLCYCGNLDGYQGIDTLVDVLVQVLRKRPGASLLVVTSSNAARLRESAIARGVSHAVEVAPHRESLDAVVEQLAAADVGLVTRTCPGGFPMKLLTYMAAALPVVATALSVKGLDLGGAVTVAPDDNAHAFAEQVVTLLEAPQEAAERGRHCRQIARERFSWGAACGTLERALDETIELDKRTNRRLTKDPR